MTIDTVSQPKDIYYDPRLLEEDMPEADVHRILIHYLTPLLIWLFREENWYVTSNLLVQYTTPTGELSLTPDIAVFKNVTLPISQGNLDSWQVGEPNRPAPSVVFEIASKTTWSNDLGEKVERYGQLGVQEYFTYDPNTPPYWGKNGRLRGWEYSKGLAQPMTTDARGWLWSAELNRWLGPDGRYLRLHYEDGTLCLTEADEREAVERAALQAERQARQAEREARQAERAARREAEMRLMEERAARREAEVRAAAAAVQAQREAEMRAAAEAAKAQREAEVRAAAELAQAQREAEVRLMEEQAARNEAEARAAEAERKLAQALAKLQESGKSQDG